MNIWIVLEGDLPVVEDSLLVAPDEFVDVVWVPLACIEVVSTESLVDKVAKVLEVPVEVVLGESSGW